MIKHRLCFYHWTLHEPMTVLHLPITNMHANSNSTSLVMHIRNIKSSVKAQQNARITYILSVSIPLAHETTWTGSVLAILLTIIAGHKYIIKHMCMTCPNMFVNTSKHILTHQNIPILIS